MAVLYNKFLSDTSMCEHCIYSVEDANHYFFTCSKYTTCRGELCQTIQNIFYCDHIYYFTEPLYLLLYGGPDHGLNTNTQIFEGVHVNISASKHFI